MDAEMNNCIALGVPDRETAARMYEAALGFVPVEVTDGWTEMKAGPIRIFLVEDQVREPAFSVTVDDVEMSRRRLEAMGFVDAGYDDDEVFLRDPFGYIFNIFPRKP